MSEQQSSYRQIMKATSIFGGVQVFQIIIQIIRSKFVALYLGPTGMGIMGLLTNTTGVITNLTNFGLATSAVKDVAAANNSENSQEISKIVIVLKRLVWVTGLLGFILTFILAPWLSKLTFGNDAYITEFRIISITLLLTQLNAGQLVILQGLRKLDYLAKSNIFGSVLGLIVVVPVYYFYGIKGIVPVILLLSIISYLISTFYSQKVKTGKVPVSINQTVDLGKKMLEMGFVINLSGIMYVGSSYIIRVFITKQGSISDVGLYNAGFTIITTYVSMVFNAMGTDYYPRLAANSHSAEATNTTINQQATTAILLISPLLILIIVFIKFFILLLYTNEFLVIDKFIYFSAFGILFKSASWAISFLFMARGKSKLFFVTELFSTAYFLLFNIAGYYFWGLSGLGYSFLAGYVLYLTQEFVVAKKLFDFSFDNEFKKIFFYQFILLFLAVLTASIFNSYFLYIFGTIVLVISLVYSYIQLEKRMNLKELFSKYIQKK